MQQALLDQLRKITEEERKILDGEAEVDRDLYTSGRDFTVDSRKMLKEGRLIAVRTHTRFVYFPAHRHNFVEVLYVCEGSLTNIIDGKKVIVNKGELLFLNQFTKHEKSSSEGKNIIDKNNISTFTLLKLANNLF